MWKKLLNCKIAFWIVWTLSFAAVFIPYDQIANIRIAMLIGGRQASFFPILQYLPYFLMGMYISKYGMRKPGFWILGAALLTGAGLARTLIAGEPSRFPPSIWWILLAWLPIAVAHVSLKALADRIGDKAAIALKPLGNMGANSLYFLLASNLTIFAVSRIGVMPLYRKSAPFPFYLKQGTTGWAIAWTAIMLIVIDSRRGWRANVQNKQKTRLNMKKRILALTAALLLIANGALAELIEGQKPDWLIAKIEDAYLKVAEISQPGRALRGSRA